MHLLIDSLEFRGAYSFGYAVFFLTRRTACDLIAARERESGEGRYDIILIPYDKNKKGVVIEIKSIEKQGKPEEKPKS